MEQRLKDLWSNLWFKIVAIGFALVLLLVYGYFFTQQVVTFGDSYLVQQEIAGGYTYTGTDSGQDVCITVTGNDTAATVIFDLPNVYEESYDLTYVDQQLSILQDDVVVFSCTADLSQEYWYFQSMIGEGSFDLAVQDTISVSTNAAGSTYQFTPSFSTIANYAFAPNTHMRGQPVYLILLLMWVPIWALDAYDPTFWFRHRRGAWMSKESEPSESYYDMRRFNLRWTYPLLCLGTFLLALFAH